MTPDLYWIPDILPLRLAIMPRPRAGDWLDDEIRGLKSAGLTTVVSLLESREERELDLQDEGKHCAAHGVEVISFPIVDRGVPPPNTAFRALMDDLVTRLRAGQALGIHCRAGIGRSGLISGCVLSLLEVPTKDIFPMLTRARRTPVPDTVEQEAWVSRFAASVHGKERS